MHKAIINILELGASLCVWLVAGGFGWAGAGAWALRCCVTLCTAAGGRVRVAYIYILAIIYIIFAFIKNMYLYMKH